MLLLKISVIVPTFKRERVLVETLHYLFRLEHAPEEIVVIDQTINHENETEEALLIMETQNKIRRIKLTKPSIPHAMNIGLWEAKEDIVLFLDDDIIPGENLISAHRRAHAENSVNIVAGQVLQPGEEPVSDEGEGVFRFCSNHRQWINEFIGCNFSVKRKMALALGGFDENFVHVAYKFEADFSDRALSAGEKILFEPAAGIRHLKAKRGGTRSYGEHLRTVKPSHSVGEYYYLMRAGRVRHRLIKIIGRPLRAVSTRHHLRNPWWIPLTLVSEFLGFSWAIFLFLRGPRYISVLNSALKQ
jgi:GT2 family glycosyltransferase